MQHLVPMLLAVGIGILVVSGFHDIAFRTVPNWAPTVLLVLGLLLHAFIGDLICAVILGLSVLLGSFIIWRQGWMGGGDVKLLSTATVFVPVGLVANLLVGTALAGGILAFLYLLAARVAPIPITTRPKALMRRVLRAELWRMHRRGPLPYAAAIAAGGVMTVLIR